MRGRSCIAAAPRALIAAAGACNCAQFLAALAKHCIFFESICPLQDDLQRGLTLTAELHSTTREWDSNVWCHWLHSGVPTTCFAGRFTLRHFHRHRTKYTRPPLIGAQEQEKSLHSFYRVHLGQDSSSLRFPDKNSIPALSILSRLTLPSFVASRCMGLPACAPRQQCTTGWECLQQPCRVFGWDLNRLGIIYHARFARPRLA